MRLFTSQASSSSSPPSTTTSSIARLFLTTLALLPEIQAITFQPVPPPNVDLSSLGRIALAGNWDSISLYNYVGQTEGTSNTNGSQSILGRYPSGAFANLKSTDASILAMCPWVRKNGTLGGVIVGGNFTDLGGQSIQGMALYNPVNDTVTPLPGLTGQVEALYCDNDNQVVYVGGSFSGGNSTNAIAWNIGEWTNLPFLGFNGPVSAITKLPNGHIVFGGAFSGTGLQVAPTTPNAQAVNLGAANVSATSSATTTDNNPRNIICADPSDTTSANNEWLLADNTQGQWQAEFPFVFRPSKLRLWNSQTPDYGTRTFSFVTENNNAILAMTYNNAQGQLESCSAFCPLAQNASYQDFYFVNQIPINSFSLHVVEWYGRGGGLSGIELFQNDIYSYAIEAFNEPTCQVSATVASTVTTTGQWTIHPSMDSASEYLTANLAAGERPEDLSIVFYPDIKQSGNYSVTIDTPGCLTDNTCATRGLVNITGQMGSGQGTPTTPVSVELWQTNNYNKYDQIYYGYVDVTQTSFRPSITLSPAAGQNRPLTVVGQRVRFQLISSVAGLNGLYEFDPSASNNTNYAASGVDQTGIQLSGGAAINDIAVVGGTTYVAGGFGADQYSNIFSMNNNGNASSLPGGGLNGAVGSLYVNDTLMYAVGTFTNMRNGTLAGLNNIAAYNFTNNAWRAIGAGVNGPVVTAMPVAVNTTTGMTLQCVAFSGAFSQIEAYGTYKAAPVNGIALWVPAMNNWLNHLNVATISLGGLLSSYTNVTGVGLLYAGAVNSQALGISGAAALGAEGKLALEQLPIQIQPSTQGPSSANSKRAVAREMIDGVVAGTFYEQNGLNITILAGHFAATATNGSQVANLAFVNSTFANNTYNNTVTGIDSARLPADAVVLALDTSGTTLVAGGADTSGVVVYDLKTATLAAVQPPALTGGNSSWSVNAIASRPSASDVYVGGSFTTAGQLPCPALCSWSISNQQWVLPALNPPLSTESTITALTWANSTRLIIAGNMTFGLQQTNYTTLASFDLTTNTTTSIANAGNAAQVPGQISAFTATDATYTSFYAAGTSNTNNSIFLSYYSAANRNWTAITGLAPQSVVYGLQTLTAMTKHNFTSPVIAQNQVLLASGALVLPNYGNVSAALFDGQSWTPFLLSAVGLSSPGSLRRTIVQNPSGFWNPSSNSSNGGRGNLAKGFVVLISLAIALALIFLMVVAGILLERWRRRQEGYRVAPSMMPQTGVALKEKGRAGEVMSEKRVSRAPQLPPFEKEARGTFSGGILGR